MTDSVVNKLVTENYSTKSRNLYPTKKIEGQNWGAISVVTLGWFLGQFILPSVLLNSIEIRIGTLIDKNLNIEQKCTALLDLKKCANLLWNCSLQSKNIANYVFLITTNIAILAVLGFFKPCFLRFFWKIYLPLNIWNKNFWNCS